MAAWLASWPNVLFFLGKLITLFISNPNNVQIAIFQMEDLGFPTQAWLDREKEKTCDFYIRKMAWNPIDSWGRVWPVCVLFCSQSCRSSLPCQTEDSKTWSNPQGWVWSSSVLVWTQYHWLLLPPLVPDNQRRNKHFSRTVRVPRTLRGTSPELLLQRHI